MLFFKRKKTCKHDWYYLPGISYGQLLENITSEISGRIPCKIQDDSWLRHRVCLKCEAIENEIPAARLEILLELAGEELRRQKADEIIKRKGLENGK